MDSTSSLSNGAWPQIKMQAHEMGKNEPTTAPSAIGSFKPKAAVAVFGIFFVSSLAETNRPQRPGHEPVALL
jgi:hypothetical protein